MCQLLDKFPRALPLGQLERRPDKALEGGVVEARQSDGNRHLGIHRKRQNGDGRTGERLCPPTEATVRLVRTVSFEASVKNQRAFSNVEDEEAKD